MDTTIALGIGLTIVAISSFAGLVLGYTVGYSDGSKDLQTDIENRYVAKYFKDEAQDWDSLP